MVTLNVNLVRYKTSDFKGYYRYYHHHDYRYHYHHLYIISAFVIEKYVDGLMQDHSISIANALEILQSYAGKPSIYASLNDIHFVNSRYVVALL